MATSCSVCDAPTKAELLLWHTRGQVCEACFQTLSDEDGRRSDAAARAASKRKWLRLGASALGVLVVGVLGWQSTTTLADAMIEDARSESEQCLIRLSASGEGDPRECARPLQDLAWPKLIPWKRERALRVELVQEYAITEAELEVATTRELDRDARDRAAAHLLELDEADGPHRYRSPSTFELSSRAGALEVMAREGHRAVSSDGRRLAVEAALILGDWRRASEIASGPALGMRASIHDGITLCLSDRRDEGLAKLRDADAARQGISLEIWEAAIACGGDPEELFIQGEVAKHEQGALDSMRWALADGPAPHRYSMTPEVAVTVAVLALPDAPSSGELDELLAVRRIGGLRLNPPESAMGSELMLLPPLRIQIPEKLGNAAERLERWAPRMPEHCDDDHETCGGSSDEAITSPRAAFYWSAFVLWANAAGQSLWRGDIDHARAYLHRARALTAPREATGSPAVPPRHAFHLVGLIRALDGPQAAADVIRSLEDEDLPLSYREAARTYALSALVLADAGEVELALGNATKARHMDGSVSDDDRAAASWVGSTAAFKAGLSARWSSPTPPEHLREGRSLEQIIAYWVHAAGSSPADKAKLRWFSDSATTDYSVFRMHGVYGLYSLELLALAADDPHVETWLDTVKPSQVDPLAWVRARLAIARDRGDDAAASLWADRERALVSRLQDDRNATLYRLLVD